MSKAGLLTRSVSKRVRPADTTAGNNHHANAMQAPSNAQVPQPHAGLAHRLGSDEIIIGLALGSPRQSPTLAMSPDDRDVGVPSVCSSPEKPASTPGNPDEMGGGSKSIKRKGSKWKTLGSFFGRRGVRSPPPLSQLDQKQQSGPAKQLITQDQFETNALCRKRADSGHGSKVRQLDLSKGMLGDENSGLLRRTSLRRRGLRRRKVEEGQPEMERIPAKYTAHAIAVNLGPRGEQQESRMPGSSLLQVEIPCVELERYSVMFGDVLKPQIRHSKPQPSLLARRQAHLEELHTVADLDSKVRFSIVIRSETTGSDTSKQPVQPVEIALPKAGLRADSISLKSSKSPSFPLLLLTPPHSACSPVNRLLLKPKPSTRSSTEPSHRLLPPRSTNQTSNSQDQNHVFVKVHKSEDFSGTPTSHGRRPSSDPFQRSANSTKAGFSECAEYPEYSFPTVRADTPTPMKGVPQDSVQRAFPARKSSIKYLGSLESRYRHQVEEPIGPTAEVSIARQISISRRQRQLLVPIAPNNARQAIQPRTNEQSTAKESRKSHLLTVEDA